MKYIRLDEAIDNEVIPDLGIAALGDLNTNLTWDNGRCYFYNSGSEGQIDCPKPRDLYDVLLVLRKIKEVCPGPKDWDTTLVNWIKKIEMWANAHL